YTAIDAMAPDDKSRLNPGHSLRNLVHDNSSTSRWRRNRSSANLLEQVAQSAPAPAPANPATSKPAPKLERTASKMSLFNLFSKPKVEKARGHTEVGLAIPMQPQQPPKRPVSPPKSSLRHNPPPPIQQVQRMRSSQMLRPMSIKPSNVKRPPANEHWEPPPLFQAYPQSIKYATVQACVFSPDVLLRTQSQRRQAEMLRERMDSHRDLAATLENASEHKKLEKNHRRLNSVLHSTPQLTNKVYVLVTSGYVLQYAGDGPFDRLPEKVLKLGKESAAFACDLIPGKHWVLQISQSAKEDGTVSVGPKNSLLSRLRLQGNSARRQATSFLLVLESAEEMETWMTAVRREIEHLGGMKASDESIRTSSSIDEPQEKKTPEQPIHRYLVQRDPNRISKMTPIDSPLQSQYSDSPKIVASDWEGDRSEKTISIADTTSLHSARHSTKRRSVEVSSIATTAISHEQIQLDQLRERSRFSYVSTATSVSGPGTRNTSRTSSPAPTSPLKEGFSPADAEPLRSATSLRSFHMNPGNTTTRRRSMQPLPITNEDSALSAGTPSTPQRHSIYGPTSPTLREPGKLELNLKVSTYTSASVDPHPANNVRLSTDVQPQIQTPLPARYSTRSSSAPPSRRDTISPPPRDPAPYPPGRPQSTIGSLPTAAALSSRAERRISATPKPFLRPFPVRPQTQNADGSLVVPRRQSSLMPAGPTPLPLNIVVNRSVTAPTRPPSAAANMLPQSQPTNTFQSSNSSSQQLRRPTSVQIRSDHAPFLSSSRPVRYSSTPSFVPGKRASVVPTSNLRQSPSMTALSQHPQQTSPPKGVGPRRSMPVIGLPPPAPPPDMPLPPPPP
ncbi:hypothetical protein BU26DRAFT_398476, partial [Trematosphaeria pertusa]